MGQNQVKQGGDAESPEHIPFLSSNGGSRSSADPKTKTKFGGFPLHSAARLGDLEKVKELLQAGNVTNNSSASSVVVSVRGVDEDGRTPLHCSTLPESSHNLQVIQLLVKRDKEDNPSSEGKPLLANLQDGFQKTALHYAAESKKRKVVSVLLEFGADPNPKADWDNTPLHILAESNSDSALECSKLILDAAGSTCSETNGDNETPLHNAARSAAPKLLRLFIDRGSSDIALGGFCGYSPLIMVPFCSKDESEEALECVRLLLDAYSPEQVNASGEDGLNALLMAASRDMFEMLKLLLSSPKTDLFAKDSQERTAFHYAIYNNNLSTLKALCECKQMSKEKFVEILFHSHEPKTEKEEKMCYESPVEIALHFRHTKIVEYLLAAHPSSFDYGWMGDEVLMSLIYSTTPTALVSKMNKYLKQSKTWDRKSANIYFVIIMGMKDPVAEMVQETRHLIQIKKAPKEEQQRILLHPLVQMFLEEKWKRMRPLTWIHMFLQLSWILCYTLMVYEMYAPNCHNTTGGGGNHTGTEEDGGSGWEDKGNGHMRILSSLGFLQWEGCNFHQTAVQCTVVILYLLSALVLLKESFQIIMKPKSYFWDVINWVQLGIVAVAVTNSAPAWQLSSASELVPWQTNLAAVGIFVAWVMLLSELDNFPKCALYSAILRKVLWNCLKTLLFYFPMLMGFAMCLRLLTPGKGQHNYLLFSLIKVMVMMTGELEFEGTFYGDDGTSTSGPSTAYNDIIGQVVLLLLVFVTTIALLNLLTGLAVNDVKLLMEEADANRLSMQLERMYMLESFIIFARKKLICVDSWTSLLYRLNVIGLRGSDNKYSYCMFTIVNIEEYPEECRAGVREVLRELEEK